MNRMPSSRGFTLLEVLVALVIVAFGMGALMATLTSAADSVGHLRDKSFAAWIALNRISELRLASRAPSVGKTSGELEYAGARWRWNQEVTRMGIGSALRIEVAVAPAPMTGAAGNAPPTLASAWGFRGGSLTPNEGVDPDWAGVLVIEAYKSRAAELEADRQPQNGGTDATPAPPPAISNPEARQ
jgi:general secretion pathway protein I